MSPDCAAPCRPVGVMCSPLLAALAATVFCSALAQAQPSLRVEYGGCANVVEGPVCLIGDEDRIVLWVRTDPGASIEVRHDRTSLAPQSGGEVQAGLRYEFSPAADTVEVRAQARDGAATSWSLSLRRDEQPEYLTTARGSALAGRLDEAQTMLQAALESQTIERRGKAYSLLARIRDAQGDSEAAHGYFREAVAWNLRDGFRYDAIRDATALAFALTHGRRDFAGAFAILDKAATPWNGPAEGAYFLDHFRGLVAFTAGDPRTALRHLGQARDRAQRLGWPRRELNSETLLAVQLRVLGRGDEARDLMTRWRGNKPDDMPPCEYANVLTNIGWIELLALEAGEPATDPTPVLQEAMTLYRTHCPAQDRVNGLVNLALAQLHGGDLDASNRYLEAARAETDEPELRMVLWADDVAARIALARRDFETALATFASLEELAAATLSPGAQWRAQVGEARVLGELGKFEEALAAYAAADRALDDAIYRVPFDEGRERLVATRAWATAHHLDLLLETGRDSEAFALVRRARNRMLQSLRPQTAQTGDARWDDAMTAYRALHDELVRNANRAWLLPADMRRKLAVLRAEKEQALRELLDAALQDRAQATAGLPALDSETHTLAFHPLPVGWAVFVHGPDGLQAVRADCSRTLAADPLALCLLGSIDTTLREARRLSILAAGALRGVDFHALPWKTGRLIDIGPVVYTLDLPGTPSPAFVAQAVLVADPRGDLRLSQQEVRTVAGILRRSEDWQVDVLEGPAATNVSVRDALARARLFHFAGHARFAGAGGWQSELLLSDRGAFDIADILALPSAPSFVVLSGCETAASSGDPTPESIGLAHAFLSSGSAAVLAATRPVADELAYRFMARFYSAYLPDQDAAGAVRLAQLALRAEYPDDDWAAFRLLER